MSSLHDLLKIRPSFLFILLGWSCSSLTLSMEVDLHVLECSWMQWLCLDLCSVAADIAGCPSWMRRLCSVAPVMMD
jgi:hypothetical protein